MGIAVVIQVTTDRHTGLQGTKVMSRAFCEFLVDPSHDKLESYLLHRMDHELYISIQCCKSREIRTK